MANNKAELTYPIGLPTMPDMNLLNSNTLRNIGYRYTLISPKGTFDTWDHFELDMDYIGTDGGINTTSYPSIVRPVISVAWGAIFTDGDGSPTHPYIVE